MDLMNSLLNFVVPPASLLMLAFTWPTLFFITTCEWLYNTYFNSENMEDKVVLITGASSGIGERETSKVGGPNVLINAADVVKEEECRRFITETINYYGRVDHLVNTVSLGHTFYFEEATDSSVFPILMDINFWGNVYPTYVALPYLRESNGRIIVNASVENWLPLPRMSLYSVSCEISTHNFYETLRFEVKNEVGITVATHGWIGTEMTRGKFMVEEGAEMQWKEEREVHVTGGPVEEFAKQIVSGACRGDPYVKYPSWYDIFFLYRVFAPKVLDWTFRFLLTNGGARRTSFIGTGRPLLETSSPRRSAVLEGSSPRRLPTGSLTFTPAFQQQKSE
ncbi:UNVERIFIED_CONTAM: 11-beta-hydroxysteroid dehydrogenase-like 5 [Sesamum calycinum]|uniref:11-beta-hydroxysteroid dehydrogenase-like 5 n=1 Tax=Sesamum calycinum TaxID=2727403 RepID=A0AAW2P5B6_9LAMI